MLDVEDEEKLSRGCDITAWLPTTTMMQSVLKAHDDESCFSRSRATTWGWCDTADIVAEQKHKDDDSSPSSHLQHVAERSDGGKGICENQVPLVVCGICSDDDRKLLQFPADDSWQKHLSPCRTCKKVFTEVSAFCGTCLAKCPTCPFYCKSRKGHAITLSPVRKATCVAVQNRAKKYLKEKQCSRPNAQDVEEFWKKTL
eukprot:CAMPEP_0172876486 /NCGR_PEP_ID=MMETSP1075-20121228/104440_1 /TAXON_ID=2916 /ORGANISM="Ceratium fusus, Strain PA161109" /LENGTH=199 /DNA_ID=CAMNT_0013727817 /DNA_START=15 /DNA_END=611 /DNA_ORIENTATION=+